MCRSQCGASPAEMSVEPVITTLFDENRFTETAEQRLPKPVVEVENNIIK
jgi:hypothetical protein